MIFLLAFNICLQYNPMGTHVTLLRTQDKILYLRIFLNPAFLACNASAKLPALKQCRVRMRRLFHYSLRSNNHYHSLSFSLLLSRGSSKVKIVSLLLMLL